MRNESSDLTPAPISLVILRLEIDDIDINSRSPLGLEHHSSSDASVTKHQLQSGKDRNNTDLEEKTRHNCSSLQAHSKIYETFSYESPYSLSKKRAEQTTAATATEQREPHAQQSSDIETLLDKYSERFDSKEEALRLFIGKRESQLISIETFYFDASSARPFMSSEPDDDELIRTRASQLTRNEQQEVATTQPPQHDQEPCVGEKESGDEQEALEEVIAEEEESTFQHCQQQHLVNNALTMQKALETAYSDWNKIKCDSSKETTELDRGNEQQHEIKSSNTDTMPMVNQLAGVLGALEIANQPMIAAQGKGKEEEEQQNKRQSRPHETNEKQNDCSSKNDCPPDKPTAAPNDASGVHVAIATQSSTRLAKKKQASVTRAAASAALRGDRSGATTATAKTATDATAASSTKIAFYYGNPTVDLVKGFMHIYKDCNLTQFGEQSASVDVEQQKQPSTVRKSKGIAASLDSTIVLPQSASCGDTGQTGGANRSEMLCMIGIPASINCNELLAFIMPFNELIEYMRIIRDTYPNQYMAVLKFKSQNDADTFYSHNNNKPFNSIEDNMCHLVFVERIEAKASSKGGSLPIPGFTELPTCYICLERMDESLNGVITILCNHSFHANCLAKWGDTCCPVCRYAQTPDYATDNACTECGSHESLWICLICGHIGCGRYVQGHAYNHFQLTQHTYSMQLGSNRVWDYAADNYVHRLIQNKTDGKLVHFDESGRVINQDEKIDSITMELDSQRMFFEDRLSKNEERAKIQLLEFENKSKEHELENSKLNQTVTQLGKEKTSLEKKCATLTAKVNKLQADLQEEQELNKCLASNQERYQAKLNTLDESLKKSNREKESEINDLKAQLRDVMFYLDAQAKFSDSKAVSNAEIQDSRIQVVQQETAPVAASSGNLSASAAKAATRKRKN